MMLWHTVGIALTAAAVASVGVWNVQEWRHGAKEGERIKAEARTALARAEKTDGAAVRHETTRAVIQTARQTLTQETDRAISAAPDWHAGACFDDDGLRSIRAAYGPDSAASEPATALPPAGASE
jgi:hypothetical protein